MSIASNYSRPALSDRLVGWVTDTNRCRYRCFSVEYHTHDRRGAVGHRHLLE